MIKKMLEEMNFKYTIIDAEENPELAKKYDIMQAPTLVAVNGENAEVVSNASNIIAFVNQHLAA